MEPRITIRKDIFDAVLKHLGAQRSDETGALYVAVAQDAKAAEAPPRAAVPTEPPMIQERED